MKYILIPLTFFISSAAMAQGIWQADPSNRKMRSSKSDSVHIVPRDTSAKNNMLFNGLPVGDSGRIAYQFGKFWGHDATGWGEFATSIELSAYMKYADTASMLAGYQRKYPSFTGWSPSYTAPYSAQEGSVFPIGGDTLMNIFRLDTAQEHAGGKGQIVQRVSYDNGMSWTVPTVVYDSPQDDRNIVANRLDNGRIVVIFRRYTGSSTDDRDIVSIYSDNKGATWSSPYSWTITMPTLALSFGTIVKAGDGDWHAVVHGTQCHMYRSADNGATWVYQSAMLRGETSVAYVGGGRMIAVSRDDQSDSTHFQHVSSDNGETWTYLGRTNWNRGKLAYNKTAPALYYDTSTGMLVGGVNTRNNVSQSPYSPQLDSFYFYVQHPDSVFANAKGWNLQFAVSRPTPNTLPTYGYITLTQLNDGRYFGITTENGIMGPNDTPFGQELSSLWQFDIGYGSRYPGLPGFANPYTGGTDYISRASSQDSTSVFPGNNALWVPALKNSSRDPFAVVSTNNTRLFSVGSTGTATAVKLIGSTEANADSTNTTASTAWVRRNSILNQAAFFENKNFRIGGVGTANNFISSGGGAFGELFSMRNAFNANRWAMGFDSVAEAGSNSGGNFNIWRYDDLGNNMGFALNIRRSDGRVTIGSVYNALGNTGKFAVIGLGTSGGEIQYRTQAEMLSDLSAAPANNGTGYLWNQFSVDQSATGRIAGAFKASNFISDAGAVNNHITIRVSNSNRYNFSLVGAESGSNAGSDLAQHTYSDAGSLLISNATYLKRSNGFFGLNTSSPTERLHVVGNAIVTGSIQLGSVKIISGTGTPEGAVTAVVGSLFLRSDGGANTTMYVKESGTGSTGWVAK